eukprot:SAG31_NODE_5528_length_2476_cov_1.731174_1_plen_422_part_00
MRRAWTREPLEGGACSIMQHARQQAIGGSKACPPHTHTRGSLVSNRLWRLASQSIRGPHARVVSRALFIGFDFDWCVGQVREEMRRMTVFERYLFRLLCVVVLVLITVYRYNQRVSPPGGYSPSRCISITSALTKECFYDHHGIMTTASGCKLARWVSRNHCDCKCWHHSPIVDPKRVEPYDTIYVDFNALHTIVDAVLDRVAFPVVLISGQRQLTDEQILKTHNDSVQPVSDAVAFALLSHPNLHLWFTMNPWTTHPKMRGWPYGMYASATRLYAQLYQSARTKDADVFASYLSTEGHLRKHRVGIPQTRKLSRHRYLQEMARHRFVLSPNGDRPDCVRNYEAIGLGTVPVTQLNATLYSFLEPSGALFEQDLHSPDNLPPYGNGTQAGMALESYWSLWLRRTIDQEILRHPTNQTHGQQ